MYLPNSYAADFDASRATGIPVQTLSIASTDGARLSCFYAPYTAPTPRSAPGPALLWFHGNAGNIKDRVVKLRNLHDALGTAVLAVDYRGYGLSTGDPSESGLYDDARASFDVLAARPDVDPHRIVVLGESLGGAVAIDLAANRPVAGLIVIASFTSLPEVARLHYGPLSWLSDSRFDSASKVKSLGMPKLFVHGSEDTLIPEEMARRLFEASAPPKSRFIVQGAGHNGIHVRGVLAEKLRDFFASTTAAP